MHLFTGSYYSVYFATCTDSASIQVIINEIFWIFMWRFRHYGFKNLNMIGLKRSSGESESQNNKSKQKVTEKCK